MTRGCTHLEAQGRDRQRFAVPFFTPQHGLIYAVGALLQFERLLIEQILYVSGYTPWAQRVLGGALDESGRIQVQVHGGGDELLVAECRSRLLADHGRDGREGSLRGSAGFALGRGLRPGFSDFCRLMVRRLATARRGFL
ncbi:hypothetical protein D3C84_566800 [compost metagenome]